MPAPSPRPVCWWSTGWPWKGGSIAWAGGGIRGPVVVASRGIAVRDMVEDGKPQTDPHGWQDLAQGRIYVANIADALAEADPPDAKAYHANAERYSAEFADLDRWVRAEIASVPDQRRKVITSHDAFGYLDAPRGDLSRPRRAQHRRRGDRQGPGGTGGAGEDHRRQGDLPQERVGPRLTETLAREAGATIGGTLYVDALSPPDGPAATYVAMFRHNVPQLVAAMLKELIPASRRDHPQCLSTTIARNSPKRYGIDAAKFQPAHLRLGSYSRRRFNPNSPAPSAAAATP